MNKTTELGQQLSRTWIVIAAGLLLALTLMACNGGSRTPTTARANTPQAVQVTVASAMKQDFPVYLSGLGSIQAYYTVSLKSRVDGQLTEVRFREGEHVNKGDLLAVIDPRPYQVQLDQAQATLFKDQEIGRASCRERGKMTAATGPVEQASGLIGACGETS